MAVSSAMKREDNSHSTWSKTVQPVDAAEEPPHNYDAAATRLCYTANLSADLSVSIKISWRCNMPSLVIHAPEYQVIGKNKKSFKDTFETGIGRGYALNSTILRQISPGCQVVLLCKDRECRAEGILVKLEPGI